MGQLGLLEIFVVMILAAIAGVLLRLLCSVLSSFSNPLLP
jgi:hypothetical protein